MKVLLSALVPARPRTGVATYLRELTRAWPRSGGVELLVATPEGAEYGFLDDHPLVRVWPLRRIPGGAAGRALALETLIPGACRQARADVLLTPNFLLPALPGRVGTVAVVQDLAFVHAPSSVPFARRVYYRAKVRAAIGRADRVIATTRTMAAEIARFVPGASSRIRVATLGVAPTHLATVPAPVDRPEGDLLCVGTLEPRKNLSRVVLAHGRLCRRDPGFPRLRLVGASGWNRAAFENVLTGHPRPDRVVRTGYLPDEELAFEYRRARGLVFCSLYEGFGLPVAEAMAHGCPVLCSSGTALAEVGGGAVLLADPLQTGAIEEGMWRLATDASLRERLARAGLSRAKRFDWESCARRTVAVLEELAG